MITQNNVPTREPKHTTFASYLHGRPLRDADGRTIGRLDDFLLDPSQELPRVTGLVVKIAGRRVLLQGAQIRGELGQPKLAQPLAGYRQELDPEEAIHLVRDVLDAQLIDIEGAKVIRVQDVQVIWREDALFVSGIDIGVWGICRRLGFAKALAWVTRTLGLKIQEGSLPWRSVAPVSDKFQALQLHVPVEQVQRLHPADLADIVADLGWSERQNLLAGMTDEQMADVVEESEPQVQMAIIRDLPDERAADVLEAMEPDEAADLLQELPAADRMRLLQQMEPQPASVVQDLMAWAEDSAGALMTPDFLSFSAGTTVGEALRRLRQATPLPSEVLYLYVVAQASQRLEGVVSFRRLLGAADSTRLGDVQISATYRVGPEAPEREAISLMTRYHLLAIPVVDRDDRILGIVTLYDAMDALEDRLTR